LPAAAAAAAAGGYHCGQLRLPGPGRRAGRDRLAADAAADWPLLQSSCCRCCYCYYLGYHFYNDCRIAAYRLSVGPNGPRGEEPVLVEGKLPRAWLIGRAKAP
jgi:hypothetical protein